MSQKITSRERIRLAINHKEADRVPIDFGAMRSTGIATIAYNKLREKLGLNIGLARMYDFLQQLAYPEKEVRDIFHIDTIDAGQAFLAEDSNWKEWVLNDGSKCLIPISIKVEFDEKGTVLLKDSEGRVLGKKPKTSLYVDQTYWPLKDSPGIPEQFSDKDLSDFVWSVSSPPWHLNIYNDNEFKIFIKEIEDLFNKTDYSIMLAVGCNLFEMGTFLRGMDNFLCDIYLDRRGTERLLDKLMEGYFKLLA
jgi:uroporphyrinogen decarboxylase